MSILPSPSVGFYCHLNTSFGNERKLRNKIKIRSVQSHLNDPNYPHLFYAVGMAIMPKIMIADGANEPITCKGIEGISHATNSLI